MKHWFSSASSHVVLLLVLLLQVFEWPWPLFKALQYDQGSAEDVPQLQQQMSNRSYTRNDVAAQLPKSH